MAFINDVKRSQGVRVTEELGSLHPYVKLPSYAAGQGEKDKPKYVKWSQNGNGSINALLDSVQSQGNRIEPLFAQYPNLVPAIRVKYPNKEITLLEVPNRATDPAVRYLFEPELTALTKGDPIPLARKTSTATIA